MSAPLQAKIAGSTLEQEATAAINAPLGERGKQILAGLVADSDRAFDYALELIKKTRDACDTAEQAVKNKRNDVNTAVTAYIEALNRVGHVMNESQKALGEVTIQGERLGG